MKRRLGVLFLVLIMCISIVPAYRSFADENTTFELEATIFTKSNATALGIQVGTGWFPDIYEIEEDDIDSKKELSNGIKKYKVSFGIDENYREGDKLKFSLSGVPSDYVEATVVRNQQSGNLGVKLILKEKNLISKSHKITLSSDEPGGLSNNNASSILFSLNFNGIPKKIEATKQSDSEYMFKESLDIDDDGNPIDNQLSNGNELVGQTLNLGKSGSEREYKIVKATRTENDYNLTLKKIELENRNVKVVLDTTMGLLAGRDFRFVCAGKEIKKTINMSEGYGPMSFDLTFENVPVGEDIKLKELPSGMKWYDIIEQTYDKDKNELKVKLGRNIGIAIANIKDGTSYEDLLTKGSGSGFVLEIYNSQGTKLGESIESSDYTGTRYDFKGLVPGDYIIKIKKVPAQFADFDTSRNYKLRIATDGKPTLEIYQEDGYAYANPYGGTDNYRFNHSIESKMQTGYKHVFVILINKKSIDKKVITGDKKNIELSQVQKNIGDEVEYKLTRSIEQDHNLVLKYEPYVNIGVKTDLSFNDELDKRLEFVPGSIKIDGYEGATKDFTAYYDDKVHRIVVKDNTKPDVVRFDYNTPIKLPPEKKIEITFKVKIKTFGKDNKSIYNTFEDKTEVAPYVELNCNKKWYGGSELLNNLEAEKFIENFVIEGYFGGEKIATYDVKDYLKPESLVKKGKSKDFSFTVYKLPKYTEDEFKKPEDQRKAIEYRIVEKQNSLSNKFEQIVHKNNPLTINNVFKSEKININIFKKWELSETEKGKEESYIPVFTLIQTNSKNKDVKEYTFSKEKAELFDSNGKTFKYEIFENDEGEIKKTEKSPRVSYENGCYKIKDLPKTGPNGEEYIYEVKESKVIKSGKNVTSDFTIEGNSEKLAIDEATGEYSKTITNKEKPYVPPEKPKSPDTGDENCMAIIGLLISAMLYGGRIYLAKRKFSNVNFARFLKR